MSESALGVVGAVVRIEGLHPSVSGHQGRYELREIVNAILYQARVARESRERHEDPSAIVMDDQTVHASLDAPAATTNRVAGCCE
ncbi:transposase [Streptomyces sp. SLBN-118]|uniref:transposase n=1 Tax=Streptomyces sp. SLBN-118 TaxID=2768454 RepID=UPI001150B39C|nr:transposase [Streptomyces sp. SLBN-118]